jgi:hypothetical protein
MTDSSRWPGGERVSVLGLQPVAPSEPACVQQSRRRVEAFATASETVPNPRSNCLWPPLTAASKAGAPEPGSNVRLLTGNRHGHDEFQAREFSGQGSAWTPFTGAGAEKKLRSIEHRWRPCASIVGLMSRDNAHALDQHPAVRDWLESVDAAGYHRGPGRRQRFRVLQLRATELLERAANGERVAPSLRAWATEVLGRS